MGCEFSAQSDSEQTDPSLSVGGTARGESDVFVESASQYEEQITNDIHRDFLENQQFFLLNSALLTVQFFENYQKDIVKLFHSTTNKKEKALNRILLQHETVECFCPDIVADNVNNNVRYIQMHGPRKNISDTLAPKRLFVVYDRIEVVNSVEIPQYTSIDKPAYQARLENSDKQGYVRLKYIDTDNGPKSSAPSPPEPCSQPPEPMPSTSKDPDPEIYDYNTIYELKTPKPLEVIQTQRRDTMPDTCFTTSKVPISQVKFAELKMQNEGTDAELKIEDYFDTVVYIDAEGFMNYFKNVLYPNSLGRSLGFTDKEIGVAKAIPGKIFCNISDLEDKHIPCEVIPAVSIPWPEEQTYEFLNRQERPTITDRRTGCVYRWPTDEMLNEIKTMNCVAVPNGYLQKKGQAADASIEWEIAFPKAERYFEARMSHVQLKCYMFLLALHKTYIEPVTKQHGLLPEHIRCHMFWECEANYRDWPEHRLGYKIVEVIKNLNKHLSRGELPDFFIKSKNLFLNIPKKYLQAAQRQFHIIVTSPTMYFFRALRNIRYTSGRFYTSPNFKELYNIITQPQGPKKTIRRFHSSANLIPRSKKYNDRDLQIAHERELEMRAQMLRRKKEKEEEERQKSRKGSIDSIDVEWICKNELEKYDSRAILTHFIKIYIEIAKDSTNLGAGSQGKFYLKLATYFTTILERISPIFRADAVEFKASIHELELAFKKKAAKANDIVPPMTPPRISGQFDFSFSQQLRNNTIDRENLGNSFLGGESKVKFVQNPGALKTPKGIVQKLKFAEGEPRKSVSFVENK